MRLRPRCGRIGKLRDAVCIRCGTEPEFLEFALASEFSVAAARGRHARPPRRARVTRSARAPARR